MEQGLRVCRKCLLRESTEADYLKNLDNYIKGLDEDLKVTQELYEERLMICRDCPQLMNGMCRICGCFVELRAALKVRKCPALPPKWRAVQETETDY